MSTLTLLEDDSRSLPLTILLTPRPYARGSGQLVVVPLLPQLKPIHLPAEIWERILLFCLSQDSATPGATKPCTGTNGKQSPPPRMVDRDEMAQRLVRVCHDFKVGSLQLLYVAQMV